MWLGGLTRNNITVGFFERLFDNLAQLDYLTSLQLHVYGNGLNNAEIIYILDKVGQFKLTKFLFSFMEYLIDDAECIDQEVLNAFDRLEISDKTIC